MRRSLTAALVGIAILVVLLLSSIFVVDEREKALVLQFGQIRQVREEPGLGFKLPFIQEVVRYDDRILSLDTDTIEVTPSDDRRLVVDAFARFRIDDPVRFRQAVGAGGVPLAQDRLAGIINAEIREVLGSDQVTSDVILSAERGALMTRIREGAQADAVELGLVLVDVRLKQTALPAQNLEATFARMRAEREREAADERARGNEAAQRVRATADRTVVETLSEARREAQIIQGEADAEANGIFAEAYGADPEFFEFYRSLQAYERALQGSNSTMVLTPDSPFFDYLYSGGVIPGEARATAAEPAAAGAGQAVAPAEPAVEESAVEESGAEEASAGDVTVTVDDEAAAAVDEAAAGDAVAPEEPAAAAPDAGTATGATAP
jgi:membrane protease subunit HflC